MGYVEINGDVFGVDDKTAEALRKARNTDEKIAVLAYTTKTGRAVQLEKVA